MTDLEAITKGALFYQTKDGRIVYFSLNPKDIVAKFRCLPKKNKKKK